MIGAPVIAVIGCGLHFRTRYFEVIQTLSAQGQAEVALVIDLESQEQVVRKFFKENNFFVPHFVFIPEQWRNNLTASQVAYFVNKICALDRISHVVISTEPKAHKPFIIWALNNNWHIFVDKPLTAFASFDKADTLLEDYYEIMKALEGKHLNCVMSCERRMHEGYCFLFDYLKTFIKKYRVPITFIDIHFAGGKWVLPQEYTLRENHPYKYGYGELLHSGYHYIDLLSQLLSLNRTLFDYHVDELDLHVLATNPAHMLHDVTRGFYQNMFNLHNIAFHFKDEWEELFKNFGEIDCLVTGRIRKHDKIFTGFSLKLITTSVSRRDNFAPTDDSYAQNEGRIRQESVIIHLGPLCSIHVTSNPYSKICAACCQEDFNISIMHNPTIVQEEPLLRLGRTDFSENFLGRKMSMNIMARRKQLLSFLQDKDANSAFVSHQDSVTLLTGIYKLVQQQAYDECPKIGRKCPQHEYGVPPSKKSD